jgi:hypothetical protein
VNQQRREWVFARNGGQCLSSPPPTHLAEGQAQWPKHDPQCKTPRASEKSVTRIYLRTACMAITLACPSPPPPCMEAPILDGVRRWCIAPGSILPAVARYCQRPGNSSLARASAASEGMGVGAGRIWQEPLGSLPTTFLDPGCAL